MQPVTSSPFLLLAIGLAAVGIVLLVLYLRTRSSLQAFKPITDLREETARLFEANRTLESRRDRISDELKVMQDKFKEAELNAFKDLEGLREQTISETQTLREQIDALRVQLVPLDQQAELFEYGLYEPHYDFGSSQRYAAKVAEIWEDQKAQIKDESAVLFFTEWTVEGRRAKGRKMENEYSKLMLRAFNGECDALIMKVRRNNIGNIEKRVDSLHEAVNKLGRTYKCEIAYIFYKLKLSELHLVYEYQEKKQAEAEEQRQIREQMREEEKAAREIERAMIEAEREEVRYEKALKKARQDVEQATGTKHARLEGEIERLQVLLDEAHQNRERAKSRAELTRSGYVYVISNIGSFGEGICKIGMIRRLDPMDRVTELGDASVPFAFDVHAMIFSEDAPRLENALHRAFDDRRVNCINLRKEFFRVSLEEIQKVVSSHKADIQFTLVAEAKDFRQSQAILTDAYRPIPALSA